MPLWKLIGPFLAASFVVTALGLAACERRPVARPSPGPLPTTAPPQVAASPPLPPPTIGRLYLLAALEAARAAYAAGEPDPAQNLAGRRFSIRQAFGCAGAPAAAGEDGVASAIWDPKTRTVEIRLTPADWSTILIVGDDANRWEAAEGYWITHPWLLGDDCPAARPGGSTLAPAPSDGVRRTDGLAAVFERDGSRIGRRSGKPFSLTVREAASPPPASGYRLVVEGRFAAYANGPAIRCHARTPDDRPTCLVAAALDRVAIESADGDLIQEWRVG